MSVAGGLGPYQFSVSGLPIGASLPAGTYEELPPGLSLDSNTGVITGTPDPGAQGTYRFDLVVDDSFQAEVTAPYYITIAPPPQITSPAVLPPASVDKIYPPQVIVGESSGQTVAMSATGGTAPYTWAIAGGSWPSGTGGTPIGLLPNGDVVGIPGTGAQTGTALVTVTDALGSSSSAYVTIPVGPEVVNQSPLPTAEVGVPYNQALDTEGGTSPYSWAVKGLLVQNANGGWSVLGSAGTLPGGLHLAAVNSGTDEAIQGHPTTPGSYRILIEVKDSAGGTSTSTLGLEVAPHLSGVPQPPSGDAGTTYSYTLQATGGALPLTWALASANGAPPSGLALAQDGTLSGTPSQIGTTRFHVRVKTPAA